MVWVGLDDWNGLSLILDFGFGFEILGWVCVWRFGRLDWIGIEF